MLITLNPRDIKYSKLVINKKRQTLESVQYRNGSKFSLRVKSPKKTLPMYTTLLERSLFGLISQNILTLITGLRRCRCLITCWIKSGSAIKRARTLTKQWRYCDIKGSEFNTTILSTVDLQETMKTVYL